MRKFFLLTLIVFLALTLTGSRSMQTTTTLYVDPAGSGMECSQDKPCATIAAALARQRQNVFIRLAPGVYREYVTLQNTRGVTIEGAPGAVISGFERVTDWRAEGDGVYSTAWGAGLAVSSNPWPSDVRLTWAGAVNTHVWIGDQRLGPVNARPTSGQFQVDNGRVYARSLTDAPPQAAEIALRSTGIAVINSIDITIRGVTIEGCANAIATGCLQVRGSDQVLIENVVARRSAYSGVQVDAIRSGSTIDPSRDVRVINVIADENGARGFGTNDSMNVIAEHVTMRANGWRYALAEGAGGTPLAAWDGGPKVVRCNTCAFRYISVLGQIGAGFWIDFRNINVVLEDFVVDGATLAGVFVEANRERVEVRRGVIRNVTRGDAGYWGALFITGTNGAIFEDLRIEGGGQPNSIMLTNPRRQVDGVETTMHGNVFRRIEVVRPANNGYIMSLLNDTTGYAGRTVVEGLYYSGGLPQGFRRSGGAFDARGFAGGVVAGALIAPIGSVVATATNSPTAAPSETPTATNSPTAAISETPAATATPQAVWGFQVSILIDVRWMPLTGTP